MKRRRDVYEKDSTIEVDPQPQSASSSSGLIHAIGTTVMLSGLVTAHQLNGSIGLVRGFDQNKKRYKIEIAGEIKLIAGMNLAFLD